MSTTLATIRLVTTDAARLAIFYAEAFGFVPGSEGVDRLGEGRVRMLSLGHQRIELLTYDTPGQAYPTGVGSADTIFQHIALVVPDMTVAMARLARVPGWTTISMHGPEHLPHSSGGVTAFKFRDPEGHPLELLQFPNDATPPAWQGDCGSTCLGYDHSAVAISDTETSLAFYSTLGLPTETYSLNRGPEQSRLDAEPDAIVEVTGLRVAHAPPHLELLCYRDGMVRTPVSDHDVAATQLVFELADVTMLEAACEKLSSDGLSPQTYGSTGFRAVRLYDPDGHRLWLTALI